MQKIKNQIRKLRDNLNLKRNLGLIWSITKGKVIYPLFLMILSSLVFMGSLYLFKLLVDIVASPDKDEKYDLFTTYLVLAGLTTITFLILRSIASYITQKQAFLISEYVDDKIHSIAIALDLSFYESPAYFNTLNRAKNAGPDRPAAILSNIISIIKNLMMLIVLGGALISINWILMPLLILFVLPTLYVRLKYADELYEWQIRKTPLERKSKYLSSLITEDAPAKEIRAFRLGNYFRATYMEIRINLLLEKLRINKKGVKNETLTNLLAAAGMYSCIAFICYNALVGKSSVGDIALFLIVFPQLFGNLQALTSDISSLYQNNIFLSYLFDLFALESKMKDPVDCSPIPIDSPDLILDAVHFNYPHVKTSALTNINLKIPSGKIVALVGLNGAGKTTLIKLLCRLYDPTSGTIKLGGQDIKNFKIDDFRKQISVVFQDFMKYNVSASENIRFGDIDSDSNNEAIRAAAKKSGADDYIKTFPDNYSTTMGRIFDNGKEVSIGQWQKLAIARAFFSNSQFLIFDEATSALDTKAEQALFDDLRQHIGNKGILIISHRVSAVKHADYVYVMGDGKISQKGTHEELISVSGDYAQLFKRDMQTSKEVKHENTEQG